MIEYIKLTDICNPKQWKTISGKNLKLDGYPVYGANGVIGYYNLYTHEHPTLMIGCRGTCGALNISVPNSYINGNAMALDDLNQELIDIKYLFYYLSFRGFKDIISGSSQPQITRTALSKVDIPLIPMPLQMKIVNILDKSQELIDKRKAQIEALDELIQSVFYDTFGDIVINSRNFETKKLKEFSESRLGKMLDKKKQTGQYSKRYVTNFNVQWFRINLDRLNTMDFDNNDVKTFELRNGDLLVCEGGEVGRAAIWRENLEDCYFQKALHRVRCDENVIIPEYLQYYFYFRSVKTGFRDIVGVSTIPHLTGEKLKELIIPIPPINQQKKFATILIEAEKQKALLNESLVELENNFNSLMQRAFNGEPLC